MIPFRENVSYHWVETVEESDAHLSSVKSTWVRVRAAALQLSAQIKKKNSKGVRETRGEKG